MVCHGEPNPKIKCTKCEKFFVKNSAMKKHYRLSHVKLQCTYCNYWTDKKRNLNKHIEIAHTCKKCSMKCNMQNHSCRMKIKSFKCTICQEKFSDEVAMTNHITTSWGCWKHLFGIPGIRCMFLKPKLPKESKNGFKTINYRPPSGMIFSKNCFRSKKIIKKVGRFVDFWIFMAIYMNKLVQL